MNVSKNQWVIVLHNHEINRDLNIYQNNRDFDFCHNRAALPWWGDIFLLPENIHFQQLYCICPSYGAHFSTMSVDRLRSSLEQRTRVHVTRSFGKWGPGNLGGTEVFIRGWRMVGIWYGSKGVQPWDTPLERVFNCKLNWKLSKKYAYLETDVLFTLKCLV